MKSMKKLFSSQLKLKSGTELQYKPPRLSPLDLQALFGRLDSDGNGILVFSEFRQIVSKLKLDSPSVIDSIYDIFKASSHTRGGVEALNLREFGDAYDILYNRVCSEHDKKNDVKATNWVRATRYGNFGKDASGDKRYIFECYSGPINDINTKMVYNLPNVDSTTDFSKLDITGVTYEVVKLEGYNLQTLNRLILADGQRNKTYDCHVMWWVDIATTKFYDSELTAITKAFGIPDEVSDNIRSMDDKRVHVGVGEVLCEGMTSIDPSGYLGNASVLSLFAQSLFINNIPMVNRDLRIVRALPFDLGRYISSRLAIFYTMSGKKCHERSRLIRFVQAEVDRIMDNRPSSKQDLETPQGDQNVVSAHCKSLPLPKAHNGDGAKHLLTSSEMQSRKPQIAKQNVSFHLQDQGFGAIALITVRGFDSALEDSGNQKWSLDQHSRSGVVGRLFAGVWRKLLEV